MKTFIKYLLKLALILILFSAVSCVAKKVWVSTPEYANATNDFYEATITPEKDEDTFYASFRLDILNKSNEELQIDWNKTLYL